MDDPLLVCGLERVGNLTGHGQRLVERNGPARDPLRQVLAGDELHDQRRDAVRVLQPVNGGNVGVIQRCEDFRFALEPGQPVSVGRERGRQNLDGDLPLQLRVGRAIDLAHSARADGGNDLVGAEARAGDQGQGIG